jgi:hypothetical protein
MESVAVVAAVRVMAVIVALLGSGGCECGGKQWW